VAGVVADHFRRGLKAEDGETSILTPREREVLKLLAEGNSARETALKLNLSVKTVETHRRHVMDKLKVRSLAGLTKYAVKAGLTVLDS